MTRRNINLGYTVSTAAELPESGAGYDEVVRRDYERHYAAGRDVWTDDDHARMAVSTMIAMLAGSEPRHVLDIGAGRGRDVVPLLDAGHDVTAIDPVPAPEWAALEPPTPRTAAFAACTLADLPADVAYDAALDVGCFHHQHPEDYHHYLNDVRARLRAGGLFVLLTFGTEDAAGRMYQNDGGRLYREFTAAELTQVVVEAGFEAVEMSRHPRRDSGQFLVGTFRRP